MKNLYDGGIDGKVKITKKPTSGGPEGGKTIRPPKRSGGIITKYPFGWKYPPKGV
jgi:hypothetical protein